MPVDTPSRPPTFRDVTPAQWKAFWATFLGWILDGFDFTIVTFLLIDIERSFTVNAALAGALGTVTLFFRVAGGILSGTAADKWGRKVPLMLSILWYSIFAGLSGFSTSYRMLFALRALFGIGMGGVWAAGMPLTMEHWPSELRGVVSGLVQSGYSVGFILSALAFHYIYPVVNNGSDLGWRSMLWIGILPAFLVLWIMKGVEESPVWLERQRHVSSTKQREGSSLARLFNRDLLPVTIHASLVLGAFLFFYHAITFWYPTLLARAGRDSFPYLLALNASGIVGNLICGQLSEGSLGRRGSATIFTIAGIASLPLYLATSSTLILFLGAILMGAGVGVFGIVPGYLTERFPTVARAAGAGFTDHVGAAIAALDPLVVGHLQDTGMQLSSAMMLTVAAAGTLGVILLWLGPETRGRQFERT
jgi:MFS transporter, SHS family, lactate transporter